MKLIKGPTSITDMIGLRHADHKADLLILKKSNARALRKQRLNVQMCCLTCEEYARRHTHTHKQLKLSNYERVLHGTSIFDKTNIMNIH